MKNENGIEKSAILKGSTKYRDIDTGEFLETFEEGRNLELVSVKMPILTTSNEDGTKTNILTVNEPIELRGIGNVRDTLDLVTSEVTERIGEIVLDGSENWIGNTSFPETNDYKLMQINLSFPIINATNTNILCDKIRVTNYSAFNSKEYEFVSAGKTGATYVLFVKLNKSKLISTDKNGFNDYFSKNPTTVYFTLLQNSIKTVNLTIQDQDNQPQEHMKLFPNGHINTSSSTFPPTLEHKGITHNNKLNMTTTNGTNNTQLVTLDNLALDGIICRDGTVVRDSYDVESGLYTKRVFRCTVE